MNIGRTITVQFPFTVRHLPHVWGLRIHKCLRCPRKRIAGPWKQRVVARLVL